MREYKRGSALLAVMWLSLALSAIAFAVAATVHGETERVSTAVDGTREYYLASGAIERAILHMLWGQGRAPTPDMPYYHAGRPVLRMSFPTGEAEVEVIPETAKYNLNRAGPEDLLRLLAALGTPEAQARQVVESIIDWRSPSAGSPLDQFYLSLTPSFRSRHASFEEIEELLVLKGMTTDLYYGGYDREPDGRLYRRGGLAECVSIWGAVDRFDINTAPPAVLVSLGLTAGQAQAIVERRREQPFLPQNDLGAFGTGRLRVGGNSIFTLRATARLRTASGELSDMRRSVAAVVKLMPYGYDTSDHILRWYDNAFRN